MDGWKDGWVDGRMDGRMGCILDRWKGGWRDRGMNLYRDKYIHTYMQVERTPELKCMLNLKNCVMIN